MKKLLIPSMTWLSAMLVTATAICQPSLIRDQNPNYQVSLQAYSKMADSINSWHGTTLQETYKAIDYLADKREARAQRRAARHELRMARARWDNDWYYDNYSYYPGYYNYNNSYYGPSGFHSNLDNYLWGALPLVTAIGLASWWRCW